MVHKRANRKRTLKERPAPSRGRPTAKAPKTAPPERQERREQLIGELELQLTRQQLQAEGLRRKLKELEQSAAHFAWLFNVAPVGLLVLNNAGVVTEVNAVATEMLGLRRESVLGKPLVSYFRGQFVRGLLEHLRYCKSAKTWVAAELELSAKGITRPVELISSSFEATDGLLHIRMTMIDIRERRRAEEALRFSERSYRNLVNSVPGIVWESLAAPGSFTFVSRQAERILGHQADRWLREPTFWEDHVHPDDRAGVLAARRAALLDRKGYIIEYRMFTVRGEIVWLRDYVSLIPEPGDTFRLQGITVEITELKHIEAALRDQTRTLETINRIGASIGAEANLEKLVHFVADAGKQITGAKHAAFSFTYSGPDTTPQMYTTPGATEDTFAHLTAPSHPQNAPPSQAGRESILIDDLSADPRVAKNRKSKRNREGDEVMRSYLAVPVVSRAGETMGTLLFVHPQAGIFNLRSQSLVVGIASEAGIALDNARLYQAVTRSEAHFRQLADAMPQIVWTAQPNGRIDYFNRRWREYTGQSESANGSMDLFQFLNTEDADRCKQAWQKSIATGETLEIECRLRQQATNQDRWHLIRAVPTRDEQGRISGWFGTCTDIEDQKRVEEEIRELNSALERRVTERTAQLQASNRELEAFSYSVSHDLRAPLRSIDAFSQLVREDYEEKLDDQGKQYLNIVSQASKQMARLIDDLLHLSRVSRAEIRRQPVNLSSLAEDIITNLQQLEPARDVEVSITPDLIAEGDERLLRIALENLLNNAWKFTSKRSSGARIKLGSETHEGQRVFYVRDNGAGFDMTYSNKLFGAFQRLHSAGDFPGHGIGLATVQRIISRHGGRIWANAAVDRGATFYFTVPSPEKT